MKPKYYITTPIYFPSAKLHIGHSYSTTATDSMARYKKMRGFDVKFLTGTDEHGVKIEKTAKENNVSPKEYVDKIVDSIKKLWDLMDIDYDIYMRTTDDFHIKTVQKIFKKLYDQGDIYKGFYEGLYCTPCETFFTESQLKDGKCPDCNREVEKVQEESYFFKLSKFQDRLTKHIEENPEFIMPESRKKEMINNFLKPGLEDIAVSRTTFTWGIPVEFDPEHIVYVWIDALTNYITALGYLSEDDSEYKKYWPADVHIVGKEIVRFHSIIWPAILMALGEPLPKQIFGHGWIVIDGGKMSKSIGNVVDPHILTDKFGVDAIRYFLLREFAFGQDGNFTYAGLIQRINADLANDLGNLVSRTVGMIEKYFAGVLPGEQVESKFDTEIIEMAEKTVINVEKHMDKLLFNEALIDIWAFIRRVNKYTDENEPWVLVKDDTQKPLLARVLYVLAESLRIISILISPIMTRTPKEIWRQLNITDENILNWDAAKKFGLLNKEVKITKGEVLFPRMDIDKELAELEKPKEEVKGKAEITIDEFSKIELKTGIILACEKVKKSDKLLKSQIKIGSETRQIVSGIAEHYKAEDLIGKTVVVVTNLKPTKIRGELSEGMILAASDENGNLNIITQDGNIEDGSEVR